MNRKAKLFNKLNIPFLPEALVSLLNKYQKLIIYGIIGGGAVVIDVGLFWLLNTQADLSTLLSNTTSVSAAMLYSFLLNAFFNFQTRDNLFRRFMSFAVVTFCGYLLSSGLLWLFSDELGFNATLIKTLSLPLILLLQFNLNSRFTFQATHDEEDKILESIN